MTDVEADGVISETLALRKELGSGSDVKGRARWWIRVLGNVPIQFQDYSEEKGDIHDDGPGLSARLKILCSLCFPETLALRKELGSGSDVTLKCQILVPRLGLALVGECAIQFQDYSEARVISMMTVEFQATVGARG
ncbi:Unconventional Myosin-Xvb [Manis pentadactyla]|nr:Unconventional Myosin-Xvb [Manis pentadactyla]